MYECLLGYGNTRGRAWPAADTIAFRSGISTAATDEALKQLRMKGYIRRVRAMPRNSKKTRPSTRYVFIYNDVWHKAIEYQRLCMAGDASSDDAVKLLVSLIEDPKRGMGELVAEARRWRRIYKKRQMAAEKIPGKQGKEIQDNSLESRDTLFPEKQGEGKLLPAAPYPDIHVSPTSDTAVMQERFKAGSQPGALPAQPAEPASPPGESERKPLTGGQGSSIASSSSDVVAIEALWPNRVRTCSALNGL